MAIINKPQKWLYPLGKCYGAITTTRNWLYDRHIFKSYKPGIPVICVGNVVVGGSCKSPFCDYLAENLILQGHRPVILTRGYGGSVRGPYLVTSEDTAVSVGDEAIMHFQFLGERGHVVIGADRVKAIEFIEANDFGDVVIMDDGLQHRRVRPHFAVLMLDVSHPQRVNALGSGLLLPAGYLRERKEEALKKVHAVVFVKKGSDWAGGELENLKRMLQIDCDCYAVCLVPNYFRDLYSNQKYDLKHFIANDVIAVSALADPQSFKSSINGLGFDPIQEFCFSDHYQYSQKDWMKFKAQDLPIITTSKDGVKLKQFVSGPGEVFELMSEARFVSKSEEQCFWSQSQSAFGHQG